MNHRAPVAPWLPLVLWLGCGMPHRTAEAQIERYSLTPARRASDSTPRASQQPHPAVVRVIATERDGASYGSGTLVDTNDAYGLVVTNWHVVEAAVRVEVLFPDGFRSPAQVLKTDRDWDLAALLCGRPRAAPVAVARMAPLPGETLSIAGYGTGDYRMTSGRCTQYLAPAPNLPYEIVELAADARQGDSGGPIFNTRGELAGVLFGQSRGLTSGSYCRRVDKFLKSVVPPPIVPEPEHSPVVSPAPATVAAVVSPVSAPVERPQLPPASEIDLTNAAPMHPATWSTPRNTDADWQTLIGQTPIEQTKSGIILLAIAILFFRLIRPGSSSSAAGDPLPSD
ncbi:MAG TPA: serine protease [Pirellulales bacterium]|nr:serine protease [Pirellulales bacterium]